jgi:hypothetical protein
VVPGAFVRFLRATDALADPQTQIVISGNPADPSYKEMVDGLRMVYRPAIPLLYMDGGESQKLLVEKVPDLAPLGAQAGKTVVHVCRGFKPEKSFAGAKELAAGMAGLFSIPPEK